MIMVTGKKKIPHPLPTTLEAIWSKLREEVCNVFHVKYFTSESYTRAAGACREEVDFDEQNKNVNRWSSQEFAVVYFSTL